MTENTPDTPLGAAVAEQAGEEKTVTVLGKTFRLTKDFSLAASYSLDKAQREESLSGLVDAFAKVIHKDDRAGFLEHVMSEPDDGEEVSTEDFFNLFTDAIQKVTGRPLDITTS